MQPQITKSDYGGQNIYIGLDVHLKSWNVTIMMDSVFQKTFSQPPSPLALRKHLEANYPGANYYSAYEAGFSGFLTHYKLLELGINSIVVNAADIPTTGKEKIQKDDSRDSRKIARCLRNEELVPIYVPSLSTIDNRSLVRFRQTVSKDLARAKCRIKSFLNFNGIEIPEEFQGKKWSKKFVQWLKDLELSSSCRLALNGYLGMYYNLHQDKLSAKRLVKKLADSPTYKEDVELLLSIPGIGLVTAMMVLTELENMGRFKSFDKLCSYIGLVPSTHSSGEKERMGNITPRGHKVLRAAIIESTWKAIAGDPALGLSYNKLCKRMKAQKAIVRIAKKLMNRISVTGK
jgi:transposase